MRQLCRIGDQVFGQAAGCLGTAVIANALTVVPQPQHLSAAEASTVPTVFMTADACLTQAAHITPGSRILVHAATGGNLSLLLDAPISAMSARSADNCI